MAIKVVGLTYFKMYREGRSYGGFEEYNVNYNYGGYNYRRNTYEDKLETPVGEFCDALCKKSDYVCIEEKYARCHEMLKEKIKKASRVEKSSSGIKVPQTKIEIEGNVEVLVEEMSKGDFCDSMRDMSLEEKERLVGKSNFFVSISSLGEKCEKDECSKEEENDLEKKERRKEMDEEKRENSKEE
ncbi:hypothetical protein M9H77_30241 [Catharanthus roseus]|uniref:Uncharacterized protein n=1 Tax=Catharanthus roseus TaxID=4058 RepID=A0ACB9ZYR5_CATRO|nr:hypothetical protein M9H77_30241 [Catharanthus roseus]